MQRELISTVVNPSQYSMGDNFDEEDYFTTSFLFEQFLKCQKRRLSL